MARMTIIFDGTWGDEVVSFDEPVDFDFDRFTVDEEYSQRVIAHVRRGAEYLAKEVGAIGVVTPLF